MEQNFDYTENMYTVLNDTMLNIRSYYSREDIIKRLRGYQSAKEDAIKFRAQGLREACLPWGIDYKELEKNPDLLENVLTQKEIFEQLIEGYYRLYKNVPRASDYMQRLTASLRPEWRGDSVRLAILKAFIQGAGFHRKTSALKIDAVENYVVEQLSYEEQQAYHLMTETERIDYLVGHVDERVFLLMENKQDDNALDLLRCMHKTLLKAKEGTIQKVEEFVLSKRLAVSWNQACDQCHIFHDSVTSESLFRVQLEALLTAVDHGELSSQDVNTHFCTLLDDLNREIKAHFNKYNKKRVEILVECLQDADENATEFIPSAELKEKLWAIMREFSNADFEDMPQMLTALSLRLDDKRMIRRLDRAMTGIIDLWHQEVVDWYNDNHHTSLKVLRSSLAEVYKDAVRHILSNEGRPVDLLKLCDDLAGAKFRTGGITRKYLYYFAFMYDLTISLPGQPYDEKRDLVKNLFHDYYNDHMLRYFSRDVKDTSIESEPTGEGINFKSYVETIYLYYLYHKELADLPGQRIDLAEKMIDTCYKKARSDQDIINELENDNNTRFYQESKIRRVLSKPIDELPDYIVDNYLIIPAHQQSPRINVANQSFAGNKALKDIVESKDINIDDDNMNQTIKRNVQETLLKTFRAFYGNDQDFIQVIQRINDRIDEKRGFYSVEEKKLMIAILLFLRKAAVRGRSLSAGQLKERLKKYKISFQETGLSNAIKTLGRAGFQFKRTRADRYKLVLEGNDEEITEFLSDIAHDTFYISPENLERFGLLMFDRTYKERTVTRSELLTVFYHAYLQSYFYYDYSSFSDVLSDFEMKANNYLISARFQPLSAKNIFDLYIILLIFMYILQDNRESQ